MADKAAAAEKLKDEADRQSMKKYDLLNYVINSFIDDFYPNNPELTTQQLIDKEEAAQAARRSFQYIMGGVFFADSIEKIQPFGKILALVFEGVKSMMGVLGGLSATLLPIPFGVLPFGSFIGAFVGWLVSMIFFLPYAAMSFSQKQFSDTAVGLFSMIPIIGIPIANMFKSGLKSGSKIYYLSSKATEEVMALFEKIRSVAETATAHSFAPGNLREKLLKTAKKLQEQARLLVREQPSLENKMGAIYPKPSAPPAAAIPPTPEIDAAPENNPFGIKETSPPPQRAAAFNRRPVPSTPQGSSPPLLKPPPVENANKRRLPSAENPTLFKAFSERKAAFTRATDELKKTSRLLLSDDAVKALGKEDKENYLLTRESIQYAHLSMKNSNEEFSKLNQSLNDIEKIKILQNSKLYADRAYETAKELTQPTAGGKRFTRRHAIRRKCRKTARARRRSKKH
jgi:hypothetical protein